MGIIRRAIQPSTNSGPLSPQERVSVRATPGDGRDPNRPGMIRRASAARWAGILGLWAALAATPAHAYIQAPHSLGRITQESTNVLVARVEKVERGQNLIIFRKVRDLKGTHPGDVIKQNIGNAGFAPRESQTIMRWAEPGKIAVIFHNGSASETCIANYWYQNSHAGEWWTLNHGEPYLLRSFCGDPRKLAPDVEAMLAGREVVVPCMVDGNLEALQVGTAKVQRLKASLKIQDYEPRRDFVGWGEETYRRLAGMPGFAQFAPLKRIDPDALGVAAADFDGDGKPDFCLFGAARLGLYQNGDAAPTEATLPLPGGARGASWADFDGDGKPDLLLATPAGPKLFANRGAAFADETARLPLEPYYCLSAATWIDHDGDHRPDILLANGPLGLRLYRNTVADAPGANTPPEPGPWHYIGPFDNAGQQGFAKAYPPEQEIKLDAQYDGARGEKAVWRDGNFPDGQVHNLAIFKPENHDSSVVYLYREIKAGAAADLPVELGSDDTLTVWLNGQKVVEENVQRACSPGGTKATLKLRPGRNALLLKICQGSGEWGFYFKAGSAERAVPPSFADVSAAVGLGPDGLGGAAKADHLAIADVDGDGRPDFLASTGTGLLARNTPGGFVAVKDSGIAYRAGQVAPAFGDFDGDGKPDLFIPQAGGGSRLFRNEGGGRFGDATPRSGDVARIAGQATCAAWADSGRPGRPDLHVGRLRAPNLFFRNRGDGTFADATEEVGLAQRIFNTRGLAAVDLNRDGTPDLVLANEGQESAVLLARPAGPGKPEVAAARDPGTIRP